jgi:hypothetical protein
MVKIFESAIKTVSSNKRKWLLRLNQTGIGGGNSVFAYALFVTHMPLGQKQAPNPMYFCKWNVEIPYCFPQGKQAAKSAYGGAGIGTRKKRMSFCNGTNRGWDITPRESGQTSLWSHVTRKFVEPT